MQENGAVCCKTRLNLSLVVCSDKDNGGVWGEGSGSCQCIRCLLGGVIGIWEDSITGMFWRKHMEASSGDMNDSSIWGLCKRKAAEVTLDIFTLSGMCAGQILLDILIQSVHYTQWLSFNTAATLLSLLYHSKEF